RRVRADPLRRAALPRRGDAHRAARDGPGGRGDPVRRGARVRADRLQAARRVYERKPPRVRAALHLRVERARAAGRRDGDDCARHVDGRPLRRRRRVAGAAAHSRHGPHERALGPDAPNGRDRALLRDRIPRPSGARELRRGVPRAGRHVAGRTSVHRDRRDRAGRSGDLLARSDPPFLSRAAAARGQGSGFRPPRDGVLRGDDCGADLARPSAAARARCGPPDLRGARRRRRGGGRRRAMMLTADHLVALLPIIVLAAAAIVVMLLVAFAPDRQVAAPATVAGLAATIVSLPIAASVAPLEGTPLLVVDGAALLYTGWLLLGTLGVGGLAAGSPAARRQAPGELYILLLAAALGAAVLAASSHFASLFLGFELLSVSLFALLAYSREQKPGIEAGAKYLILSGV